MGERTEDGKIRIRCPGCGKRVKFPAEQATHSFRCPVCNVTIVPKTEKDDSAPVLVDDEAPRPSETLAFARKVARRIADQDAGIDPERAAAAPGAKSDLTPIEAITGFMNRENQRVAKMSVEIVNNALMPIETQAAQLKELRRAKAFHFKKFVEDTLKGLDAEVKQLRDHPASETQSIQERLNKLLHDRRGLLLFLNVMFELKPIFPSATASAARPETPGTSAAPPTTV